MVDFSKQSDEIELLKDTMVNSSPVLFLGAGFSIGATHKDGSPALTGEQLKKVLYESFISEAKYSEEELKEMQTYNLKDLATHIGKSSKKNLQETIANQFKDLVPQSFHTVIVLFSWIKIYTLNIDTLIESIYDKAKKELTVQNKKNKSDKKKQDSVELFKLHGCVSQPLEGFIFGADEYKDNIALESYKIMTFCQDYYEKDVIFLGTEFSEDDITILLTKYANAGYRTDKSRYFFISPKINLKLKDFISSKERHFHIPLTAAEFAKICQDVTSQKSKAKDEVLILDQKGFKNVAQYKIELSDSDLYKGNAPVWSDIFDNWDFKNSNITLQVENFYRNHPSGIISIYGKPYCGKSTSAMRILVDLYNKNYTIYQYQVTERNDLDFIMQYLQKNEKSKIAIFIEDAASYYKDIQNFFIYFQKLQKEIYIITVSRTDHHESKKYEFLELEDWIELKVDDKLTESLANNIGQTLKTKNRLGSYLKYDYSQSFLTAEILGKQTTINFLYSLTYGQGFLTYFGKELNRLIHSDFTYKNFIFHITIFSALGIEKFSRKIIQSLYKDLTLHDLKKMGQCILDFYEDDDIKLRCADFFEKKLISEISLDQKNNILVSSIKIITPRFKEHDRSIWDMLFQKLLSSKSLNNNVKYSYADLRTLFQGIESLCSSYSYYWLQRGLIENELKKFENAHIFLCQAQAIRPRSYHVKHALAKNLMERGLYEIEHETGTGSYYFEEGERKILEIFNSRDYSRSHQYALHTFIYLNLKYFEVKNLSKILIKEKLDLIYPILGTFNYSRPAPEIHEILKKLVEFCKNNGMIESAVQLNNHIKILPNNKSYSN